jgi:D-alanyl-D-alanine carboxypeptidase
MDFSMRARVATALLCLAACTAGGPARSGPALLFEATSGKVLYAEDQDHLWHPASLTKIMTAYLTFEALKVGRLTLEHKIATSEKAHHQAPSKIGLAVGAELTVDVALRAVIVKSANDAAMMLAEAIAGSEEAFVQHMNSTAQRLGMTRTKFVNPNGLPAPDQVTTARDMAKLARAVVRDFPEQLSLWAQQELQIGKIKLRNHNGLLRTFEGTDGIKTGFTCDSGFNVVASATRDGRKLIAVVLGDPSGRERNLRAASLLDHGFQTWEWKQLFNPTTLETLPAATDAKDVRSVRTTIVSWNCNGKKLVAAKKRKQAVAAANANGSKSKGGARPVNTKAASVAGGTAAPVQARQKTTKAPTKSAE